MSGAVFDTSVYITARRQQQHELLDARHYDGEPVYLSSVVAQELYVGAAMRAPRRDVDRLWRRFEQIGRLLVPTADDWRDVGLLLSRVGQRLGYQRVGQGRLTNDALLALSARRRGLTILTLNSADFALLAQYRPFRFALVDPSRAS